MNMLISVIVSTYNWPEALNLSLKSLFNQTDRNFEIIIGDDGSRDETRRLVASWQMRESIPLIHSWQEDKGVRLGRSRNKAVSKSHGDYLIFMDGDCIVRSDFVSSHRRLAQTQCVVAGQRILLSQDFSKVCLERSDLSWKENLFELICLSGRGDINRFLPALSLPLDFFRLKRPSRWQLLRGCNWSLHRDDFLSVGGQDEVFEGWGYEDSDMAIRLINNGCSVKWGGFSSPCFHLWHKEADRSLSEDNLKRLNLLRESKRILPQKKIRRIYED